MDMISAIAALLIVSTAAFWDFRQHRIPNWLTLSAIPAGIVCNTVMGGLAGLQMSLAGFAVGFGILLILFVTGGGGGGDVKLMGALGAWLGVSTTLTVFFIAAAIILMLLLFNIAVKWIQRNKENRKHTVAFAIPVCAATAFLVIGKICVAMS